MYYLFPRMGRISDFWMKRMYIKILDNYETNMINRDQLKLKLIVQRF